MNHVKAIVMKYVFVSVALLMVLGIFNYKISVILLLSALVTGIAYIVGDLFILRKFGMVTATLADFGLAFLVIWLFNTAFVDNQAHILQVTFLSSLIITLAEIYFHSYMNEKFYDRGTPGLNDTGLRTSQYATEYAEENEIIDIDKNRK